MDFRPSRIIAGVMKWGLWGAQLDTNGLSTLISQCVEHGVNTFDHADIYGGHTTEAEWGRAFENTGLNRKEIQIITKCGIMMPSEERSEIQGKHYDCSESHILKSVDKSLENLKTDYIDLLLIHRPSPLMYPTEVVKAFDKLKSSGKVKYFGVSNFTPSQVSLLASATDLKANQIELSPYAISALTDGTLDQCMAQDMLPMAWSPLGGGKIFGKLSNPQELALRSRLQQVSEKYSWTLDKMIYLFLLHHPSQIHIVTGSSKISRIQVAVEAEKESITDAQWFEIYTAILGHEVA